MPRGYRLAIIALGLTLFATMGSGHSQDLQNQKQETQTGPQADDSAEQVKETANAASVEERSDNALAKELPSGKPTQDAHESRLLELDLAAQQRMADATEKLLIYTKGQTVIGAIGAVVLIGTLWVSVFVAIRQLRAYLMIEDTSFQKGEDRSDWYYCVRIKNFGSTPASIFFSSVEFQICPAKDSATEIMLSEQAVTLPKTVIAPGHFHTITIPCNELSGASKWVEARQAGKKAYVWGTIKYRDVFYIRRSLRFQMVHHLVSITNFSFCEAGNDTT